MQNSKQDSNNRQYYSKAQFWDQRYVQNGGFFDWYAQFPQLKYAFQTQYNMSKQDSILMVGCGNSKLSQQMHDAGYKNIINIDISHSVIQQMKKASPDMQWLVMDAINMQLFENNKFDYVIDKGTMDALIAGRDITPAVDLLIQCMRVTKQQGQLILITYGSPEGRKKIFQQGLPFNIFDYYFSYVNLNDMSTMINLMRNNIIGQNGQKIEKQIALQRSMKQFLMIKILRQKRSKDRQFIVWDNYIKKKQQPINIINQNNKSTQKQQQSIQQRQEKHNQTKQQQTKIQQKIQQQNIQQQKKPNISFSSKTQKQSYVYAYSIKRKLCYNYDSLCITNFEVKDQYMGYGKQKILQIKGPSSLIKKNLAKCIAYCQQKIISYPQVIFQSHDQTFSSNQKSIKINIKNGQNFKIRILQKTNIDLTIKYDQFKQIDTILNQLTKLLVQNLGLKLHPCPKTYSLFTVLKSRIKAKSSNELFQKYWYPTYKIDEINLQNKTAQIVMSIPPVLSQNLEEVKREIQSFTKLHKKIKIQIKNIRSGFISFPQLQLFGILNMVSLSYNKGISLSIEMQDFWTCQQSLPEEQNSELSKLFVIQHSMIETPMYLLHQLLLHLLILL